MNNFYLLNNNYTIVLVEQVTSPPNPEREVTEVISPGTIIDSYNKSTIYFRQSNSSNFL